MSTWIQKSTFSILAQLSQKSENQQNRLKKYTHYQKTNPLSVFKTIFIDKQ
jgi:hypothetical protein